MVTGAASGIGRCIALALANEGVDVCLIDINEENLQSTAQEAKSRGVEVVSRICDLSQPAQISAAINFVLSTWDHLNILVNCAGLMHYGPADAMTDAQWNRILSVNLLAPIQLVRELLPTLTAQDEAHIVNVCSIFGLVAAPRIAAYQTSKFALVGFSTALHAEYARPGFGITALCPGIIRTPMIKELELDFGVPAWIGTSPEIAAAVALRAIRRNKGLVVITPTARMFWWLARLSPGLVEWLNRKDFLRRLFTGPVSQ
jgi:3-oxoacyl-[acyl-carrier protein] reductase